MPCDCDHSDCERSEAIRRNVTIRFQQRQRQDKNTSVCQLNHRTSTSNPMNTRLISTAALALFFTLGMPVRAQEHPEHPRQQSQQLPQTTTRSSRSEFQTRAVSKADISVGIKRQIASDTKKSNDKNFTSIMGARILRSI